ncbi:MAG: serpin family protein [Pseudomonadota bacterium]
MRLIFRAQILILILLLAFPFFAPAEENQVYVETLVRDNSAFAIDLYKKLFTRTGNIFISPYSMSTSLAMTYAGAQGNTRKQMANVLRFSLEQKSLDPTFDSLSSTLEKLSGRGLVCLNMANSLWTQKGYNILPEYQDQLKTYYGVSTVSLDYQSQQGEAIKKINGWVEEKTQGRIKDIITPEAINSNTKMVLTNAICFQGAWEQKFEDDLTEDSKFFVSSGNSTEIQMMRHTGMFKYSDIESLQILEMPYAGNELSMIALLPRETEGLKAIESDISSENLNLWKNKMASTKVLVQFPKFEILSSFELSDELVSMGMIDAFNSRDANFEGIAPRKNEPLFLSAVIHKAFVEVDEEGTQASAATSTMAADGISFHDKQIPVFRADHPFIFLIQENQTGCILFMGRVSEPTKVK